MARINGTESYGTLIGTDEDDIILAFGDNDGLYGHDGDDVLAPGPGYDEVHPGQGNDTIEIRPGGNRDFIEGFNYDEDLLVFNGFNDINSYADLADFIYYGLDPENPGFTIVEVGKARGLVGGTQIFQLHPAGILSEENVVFNKQVVPPAKIIPFGTDPVFIADPSLKPPPLEKFAMVDLPELPEQPNPLDPPTPGPEPMPPPPADWWMG